MHWYVALVGWYWPGKPTVLGHFVHCQSDGD